jgi:hypothetical protein
MLAAAAVLSGSAVAVLLGAVVPVPVPHEAELPALGLRPREPLVPVLLQAAVAVVLVQALREVQVPGAEPLLCP